MPWSAELLSDATVSFVKRIKNNSIINPFRPSDSYVRQ